VSVVVGNRPSALVVRLLEMKDPELVIELFLRLTLIMSDSQPNESSNPPSTSGSSSRPVGTLRDASSTQPGSKVIGNVLNRRPTDGVAGRGGRGKMMFMPNQVVRRKVEE
jgi:hypothetical protein